MSASAPPRLNGLEPDALVELLRDYGERDYRGRQLAHALYTRRIRSLDEATDLPRALRAELEAKHGLSHLREVQAQRAADGTTKFLFELEDGARIECVALPRSTGRVTYCLSSQVGCRLACVFCATGRMGLVRQLSSSEIVEQVLELERRFSTGTHPNLVFMGMGEPLDNLDALLPALRILTDPRGVGLSARRITVSTSGLVEGIEALAALDRPIGLALSLTSPDSAERRALMPVAGRTDLGEILEVAAEYGRRYRRRVTLECAIIAGRNDDEDTTRGLLDCARRGPFKVNLIPLNPIDAYEGGRPPIERVRAMAEHLWREGIVCTVRDSQGREVGGACGQLVHRQRRSARNRRSPTSGG